MYLRNRFNPITQALRLEAMWMACLNTSLAAVAMMACYLALMVRQCRQ